MIAFLARLFGFHAATAPRQFEDSLAHSLMEGADLRSGSDARDLRVAALAYLRVVR